VEKRVLNPERVSVLDVDFDIEGSRRAQVLSKFREFYGEDRVANVATFRTEKSKSAILTAARGLGLDVDIAQYLASLVPADRGMLRTLDQCMYGDEENGWMPIKQFVIEMTDNYPELWKVAHSIEGLISGYGIHAGGVIFVDEPFTNSTGLMRAPDGTICTQFELHDDEAASLIKYDALSVEAMDKIHNCLDLLCEYGYVEEKETLKETYESIIGIYNLERDNPEMWKMVWEHKINSLFQMEKQSGINGIATLKPTSVDDLAILNSTIRLMAQERGGEMPTDKLARFKANPTEWIKEMEWYGLGEKEQKILEPVLGMSYGLCIAQEQFMELVQLPELGGFSLTWADKLRKSIAKKNPKEYDALTKEFYEVTKEKGVDQKFAHYVWDCLIAMSKGYGFNQSHTLAYSLIALQEMNLAYHYPIIFWNCACLINDAGGGEVEDDDDDEEAAEETKKEEPYYEEMEEFNDDEDEEVSSYDEDDGANGYPATIVVTASGKKKKKVKTTNYGKIASAIGKIKSAGVDISAPDINRSTYTFSPDVENNTIRYGLSGITRIGQDLIHDIIENRPYKSVEDFVSRIKCTKPQVINLIKSGAFDMFGEREEIMHGYVNLISDAKKRITLQNMKMLIDFELLPDEFDLVKRVFNFNKYIKKMKKGTTYYGLDKIGFDFYSNHFDVDLCSPTADTESGFQIKQIDWDKIYQAQMDKIRPFIKSHQEELLNAVNNRLTKDVWNKYCEGSISKWEMDSISCYIHEHELSCIDEEECGFDNFSELPNDPEIDRYIPIKGKMIPLFKLHRIAGTVLDRDKAKKTVTLLTTSGVVTIKIFGGVFAQYDKQISERGADGKKHVQRKSEFARGNKIVVIGVKDGENEFRAKKYSKTPYHLIETIGSIEGNHVIMDNRNDEEIA
jgi:DNA polymerase-3 subunit alpha